MQPGDVVLVRGHSWTSALIRLFDPGAYTHAALAVSVSHIVEIDLLFPARINPLTYKDFDVIPMGFSAAEQRELTSRAIGLCGTVQYDKAQAAWYAIRRLLRVRQRKNPWDNPQDYICTELVQRLLADFGRLPPYELIGSLTPNELGGYLQARPRT